MYLLLVIVGAGLLSPAQSLSCYYCSLGGSSICMSMTRECPSPRHQCAAVIKLIDTGSSHIIDLHERTCALPEQCTEMSINYGKARKAVNVQCCSTDLCNNQMAANPSNISLNGRKCYRCVGQYCDITMDCLGSEDSCFTFTARSGAVTLKGCASKLACDPVAGSFLLRKHGENDTMECCQEDFCNSSPAGSSAD
ncbi:urokinase plasminogen activator surface receptor-like [Synchiropus splendidus]|uniref:urokinase plasminogen activator surface receptor-like n=1 Tax=Synchiropus splendidus TaxID=270530 RepID=UPI00237D7332|nr:urokinase plasminogen activator surface receptor-like [Synchiropus splendidus]